LPRALHISAGDAAILARLREVGIVWSVINALPAPPNHGSVPGFTPPLVLNFPEALTLEAFNARVDALQALMEQIAPIERDLRHELDALLPSLCARLNQYRRAILARYAPDSAIVASLPRLTPHRRKLSAGK
jgi:hypothetical protein